MFYRVNQDETAGHPPNEHDKERMMQEKEFRIGSIGFADSLGILSASLIAVPTEIGLCRAQVARGKILCQQL